MIAKGKINLWDLMTVDSTLFDDIEFDSRLTLKQIVDTILFRCAPLTPVYPDTRMLKFYINNWFSIKKYTISKLLDTLEFEYNPIENYNRYENSERDVDYNRLRNTDQNVNGTTRNTSNDDFSQDVSADSELIDQVSAFDSSAWQNSEKHNTNSNQHTTSSDNITSNSNNTEDTIANENIDDTTKDKFGSHGHGNIGVTTSQQLIEAERNIVLFNVYEWIAREFELEFFIGDYTF